MKIEDAAVQREESVPEIANLMCIQPLTKTGDRFRPAKRLYPGPTEKIVNDFGMRLQLLTKFVAIPRLKGNAVGFKQLRLSLNLLTACCRPQALSRTEDKQVALMQPFAARELSHGARDFARTEFSFVLTLVDLVFI